MVSVLYFWNLETRAGELSYDRVACRACVAALLILKYVVHSCISEEICTELTSDKFHDTPINCR